MNSSQKYPLFFADGVFMDIYEQNINTIIDYIKKGSKGSRSDNTGVEIEHFVIDNSTGGCAAYKGGVEIVMERLAPYFDEKIYSEGFLIGLSCGSYSITLEPGAQIEISIKPAGSISEIEKIYQSFRTLIDDILDEAGFSLAAYGYMPSGKACEQALIPKKRYEFMNAYFKRSGTCGLNMMRGTASVQVSVDFAGEEHCRKRFALANILSPIFALICDNAPIFDGKPYIGNALRAYIWNNVDSDRCSVMPYAMSSDFSFRKYAEYIYNSPAILVTDGDGVRFTGGERICAIYKDTPITEAEAEHLLSMFFPDVRLKQYIEIRPADSMPIEYALSYAALIKGIFASNHIFDFKDVTVDDIRSAKEQIILRGFEARIYGRTAADIAAELYNAAYSALNDSDRAYLAPIGGIIQSKKTLKERYNLAESRGIL